MAENILIIGSGGREHAIAWKLSQSERVGKLYAAPGNAGTEEMAENVPIHPLEIDKLASFVEKKNIDLTVVGPEQPLASGIVNVFSERELPIFGPSRLASLIESSKAFAKITMSRARIPTADFRTFHNRGSALNYLKTHKFPLVIKANGLAEGKGVYICHTLAAGEKILNDLMIYKIYGSSGSTVVIEEYLEGEELSVHALCDGRTSILFPFSRDYKRVFDGNRGENTGGMGSYAPVKDNYLDCIYDKIVKKIVDPALKRLSEDLEPFVGCLYPGLKLTKLGPKVLEYNVRFGDPETQVYILLLKTDLLEILLACVEGRLSEIKIEWHDRYAVCVVLASDGYPGEYKTGFPITGVDKANLIPGVTVFHAGTRHEGNHIVTNGGRVLNVVAKGDTLEEARRLAYIGANIIDFEGMQYRKDIGEVLTY